MVSNAEAANWYVDNGATGANNGASWPNAWTSFSRVVWGTGGVQAGDTLFISGGTTSKTYIENWSVGASGTSGSPISIKTGQDPGHNGTVIFDYGASGDSGTGSGIGLNGRSHIIISGKVGGLRRLKIQNLRNTSDSMQGTGIGGIGVTASNILVEYVEIYNCNNGVYVSYSTNIEVRYCKITMRGDTGVGLIASSGSWDSHRIHHNEITSMVNSGGPDGISCSDGVSIYNNTFRITRHSSYTSDQHPDQIQATGNYLKVYNNDFVDIGDSAIDFDAWSNTEPHDVWIYNNIFRIVTAIDPYPEYFRLYSSNGRLSSATNFKILNNLFIDNNAGGNNFTAVRFTVDGEVSGTGNEIKNNIFYNCGDGSQYFPMIQINGPSGSFSFDGNVYYHPSGTSYIKIYGKLYKSSEWIAESEPNGKTGAPLFVSYTPYSAGNDLRLSANDKVAINGGVNLSSYMTSDKNGVTRPQGGQFDIGPYEYSIEVVGDGIQTPTGLRILTIQ